MAKEKNNTEWFDLASRIVDKITSGRWITTVIVITVYAILALEGILPKERVSEITLLVLYAYFSRGTKSKNNKGEEK